MSNPIPELLKDYNIYDEADKLVGVTGDITLPKLEPVTEKISGAGILGEYDAPVAGNFSSITMDITFRTIMDTSTSLLTDQGHKLYLRASQQSMDMSDGGIGYRPLVVTLGFRPKGVDLGKASIGKATDTKITVEVLYLKITENNNVLVELDKLNSIFVLNGKDQLAIVRSQT